MHTYTYRYTWKKLIRKALEEISVGFHCGKRMWPGQKRKDDWMDEADPQLRGNDRLTFTSCLFKTAPNLFTPLREYIALNISYRPLRSIPFFHL